MSRFKNFIRPVAALFAASLLFSCMKEEPVDFRFPDNYIDMGADREIRFGVKCGTETKAAAPAKRVALDCDRSTGICGIVMEYEDMGTYEWPETKVDEVTALSSFKVSCTTGSTGSESNVWNNVSFTGSSDTYTGGKVWPTSDPGYHFYGSNANITFAAGGCTVSASNGTDVVCAYLSSPTFATKNTLPFTHIFGRLGSVTVNAETGFTITSITLNITPKTGGTYNIRTGAWSSVSNGSATNVANSTPGTKSNDLYLVPGSYSMSASWTATKNGVSNSFSSLPVNITIVAGKVNNVTVTFGGGDYSYVQEIAYSVSSTKKVVFAPGNLQATISSGPEYSYVYYASTWKFADHQYDMLTNANLRVGYSTDYFTWVAQDADYNSYGLCNCTTTNNGYYGTSTSTSDKLWTDWGEIYGVSSVLGSGWYTMTHTEVNYLLGSRTNAASLWGYARIRTGNSTYINGFLILPDQWSLPSNCTLTAGKQACTTNTYDARSSATSGTTNAWCDMEDNGAVFLPFGGYAFDGSRSSTSYGYYWLNSRNSGPTSMDQAVAFRASSNTNPGPFTNTRSYASFVRLVKEFNASSGGGGWEYGGSF